MAKQIKNRWSHMTWPEILANVEAGSVSVILPIGATEQHGPHLGVGMDAVLAEDICRKLAERTAVPVLPTLNYSCSIGHSHRWPGTVSLSPTTMIAVISDMINWLYRAGIRRVFIVNCHVGNKSAIGCALDTLRCQHDDLFLANFNVGEFTPLVEAIFTEDAKDWHANAAETSLMMAIDPAMVRQNLLEKSDDPDRTKHCVFLHPVNRTSKQGVTGKPSKASLADGQRLREKIIEALVEKVQIGVQEKSPLNEAYSKRIQISNTNE